MGSYLRCFRLLPFLLIFFGIGDARAAQISSEQARAVAVRFLAARSPQFAGLHAGQMVLAREVADALPGVGSVVLYRVFNLGANAFVIISGDDLVMPVLGYSMQGAYPATEEPVHVAKWMEGYRQEIRAALASGGTSAQAVQQEWARWEQTGPAAQGGERAAVGPLVQTTWNQSPNYNALCPGGSVTGCVATAMAQVMKYHNWPAQGAGFHSYNAPNYGTLSANFGATNYNWGAMPNNVSGPNTAVATLMYHCGVGVDMQYSPQVSGAWVVAANSPGTQNNAEFALKTYFNYSNTMQGLQRANYSESQWIGMLKADLDASRPVLYDGFGSGGGHCFVCDGYDNNNFFHFNWGWGGAYDGNFTVGALNPDGVGTGGGNGGYNSGQEAIFGIQPANGGGGTTGQQTFDMGLYNNVTPSGNTIYYGQAFSVSTNIINNGTNNFSGDYTAAVFDDASNFYGFIQTLTGYTLQAGYVYNNDLVFSTSGLLTMLPGTYYIGILYRPTGGEWVLVDNNSGYTNLPQIQVTNPNDIELYAALAVSPGTSVTQGASISVSTNIINDGATTFYGQYGAALYNLDGSWAQDIGSINENNGLPGGYVYNNPFTMGPATVTVPPGTYLLAVQHNPNNTGWQLTGSSYYANPIFVTVTAPSIQPDAYEVNNAPGQAYAFPANFSGNSASVATTGSNLHNPTDQDFYKVVLPSGYNYTITARLNDSYNSGNGQTYTVDGMFSYSLDGTTWSAVYDDVMPGDFTANNGGTVYFHVAPYFQGLTGTYLLQVNVVRTAISAVGSLVEAGGFRMFPNPARDQVTIDLPGPDHRVNNLELLDAQGRAVARPTMTSISDGLLSIDLSGVAGGTYMVRLTTIAGMGCKSLVIAR